MDNPNVSRDQLSEAKRLLLEKRLKGQAKPAAPKNAIVRRGDGPAQPMSYAQERLWFLDQLEPGSAFYNIPAAVRLSARVDLSLLERALTEVVRRHEAIRTVFRLVDGKPMQIVVPPYELKIEVRDVRPADGSDLPEDEIRRLVSLVGRQPFDLAVGPLFRVAALRISEEEYALVLNMHHIVTDGWSMPIVTREMEELYEAFRGGRPSPLAELEVQYPDYSAWQRETLVGDTLRRQLDFWHDHLAGAPPAIDLPTDRPRPAVQTHRGDMHRATFPLPLANALKALGQQESASLNMVIMAVWYVLLQRWSGQDDVVVGTLLGNRNRAETESLVGFFVNSLPIRARLEGGPTFRQLLRQVRQGVLDADAHQDLPFDMVVDELRVARDLARNPVFQVMYFHHTFVRTHHHLEHSAIQSGLNARPLYEETGVALVEIGASKFDMTFATTEMPDSLSAAVEYMTDLWDESTIVRMLRHTRRLMESAVESPDLPISRLRMLDPEEEEQLLAWGTNESPYPADATIPALFEAQAERTPDAPAVSYADATLTYRALNERANRIAALLRGRGVAAGDRVGLAAIPSADTVAALLGILKAGAAVVALDPDYPAERLAFLVEDTGARLVVSAGEAPEALAGAGAEVVRLDQEAETLAGLSGENPAATISADSPAYVIYTSGSTGKPKGVLIHHRAAVRTVVGTDYVRFAPGDRVAQQSTLAFDAHIFEVWGALLNGATVVGIDRDVLLSPADYAQVARDRGVTHAFVTTQLFNQLVREVPDVFSTFRYVLFGGEQVDPVSVRRCLEHGAPGDLLHVYGPTEGTTYSTWHRVTSVAEDAWTVPIGRPIANARAYVLDPTGQPAGVGVPGELCVGGDGVALGYLGRPELTAERFVPDPFAGGEARMYRTGDKARWLPDGTIEFLGRYDDQVKVRGYRIEPGEVESALLRHPAVREASVIARTDGAADRRLVAYVAGADAESLRAVDFRGFLRGSLPDYMVPSAFVVLDALPLNPNGKVDRRALPAPEAPTTGGGAAPTGEVEAALAAIWSEVLNVPSVGVHDNFFSLGGDSILSIQIIARAAQAGIRLTPKQMFMHQTIAELAAVAGTAKAVAAEQGVVTGPVPLTPVQRWFFAQDLPEPQHFNLAFLFQPRERLDAGVLEKAFAAVLEHHDALRLRYLRTEDDWEQENAGLPERVPLDVLDLSAVPADQREAALAERADAMQTGFHLAEGPLVRLGLFDFGAAEPQLLLVVAHHLVMDAVSSGVVLQDLETAYGQLARGEAVKLPPKTTSFRQWAEMLEAHARSEALRGELGYWTSPERAAVRPLPVDHAGGANTEAARGGVSVSLDEEATRALLHDVPPVYQTQINDVLLAALALAVERWTGERAVLVDLEGHGREDLFETADLSRTAGWFTAIHPVRLELPDPADAGACIKGVKEQLREVPGKGIGWGLLRWMSGDAEVEAALAALPEAQISFNYLGQFDAGEGDAPFFARVPADVGEGRSPAGRRTHLVGIDAGVMGGKLEVLLTYGAELHERATMERLAEGFVDALRRLIEHCKDPSAGGFTPSDFPAADLDQDTLDALLAQL